MNKDDFDDGIHESLIKAFMEYFKHNENFRRKGAFEPSVKARHALSEIRRLAILRREEIFIKREERKKQVKAKKAQKREAQADQDNT